MNRYMLPLSLLAILSTGCPQNTSEPIVLEEVIFKTTIADAEVTIEDATRLRVLGDLDGDGLDEVAVWDKNDKARTKLYFDLGGQPTYLTTTEDSLNEPELLTHDVNGDGALDLLVMSPGTPHVDGATSLNKGSLLVFLGPISAGAALEEASADQQLDFTGTVGPQSGEVLVGDFDNDGVLDVALWNSASVRIHSDAFSKETLPAQGSIDGGGDVITGDFNGDGITDLAVMSSPFSKNVNLRMYFGPLDPAATRDDVESADAVWQIGERNSLAERSIHNIGDADGDGRDDLVVAAREPAEQETYAGVVYVVSGAPEGARPIWEGAYATYRGAALGDDIGRRITTGDVNGDGAVDILVSHSRNDGGVLIGPITPRPVSIFHGPHSGEATTDQDDDRIWEATTKDYIDAGALGVAKLSAQGADDILILAAGAEALSYFER